MACLDRLADGGGVEPGAFVACYLKVTCFLVVLLLQYAARPVE
jgi:hypothetical protein